MWQQQQQFVVWLLAWTMSRSCSGGQPPRISSAMPSGRPCRGGQVRAAEFLLDQLATLNLLPGWERLTPLDAAAGSGATDVITWLDGHGARTASDLGGG